VAPRTLSQDRESLDRYVLPSIGHRKLGDLHLCEIDQVYGLMLSGEIPRPDGTAGVTGRPLSARTVRLAHAGLSQALSQAVARGLIPHNPAAGATIPTSKPKEKTVLTAAERARFLEAGVGSLYGVFYRTLIDTGLRPGEACAHLGRRRLRPRHNRRAAHRDPRADGHAGAGLEAAGALDLQELEELRLDCLAATVDDLGAVTLAALDDRGSRMHRRSCLAS
jgi:hypothetical protein